MPKRVSRPLLNRAKHYIGDTGMDADLVAAAAFKAVVGQRKLSRLGSIPRHSRHIK